MKRARGWWVLQWEAAPPTHWVVVDGLYYPRESVVTT